MFSNLHKHCNHLVSKSDFCSPSWEAEFVFGRGFIVQLEGNRARMNHSRCLSAEICYIWLTDVQNICIQPPTDNKICTNEPASGIACIIVIIPNVVVVGIGRPIRCNHVSKDVETTLLDRVNKLGQYRGRARICEEEEDLRTPVLYVFL